MEALSWEDWEGRVRSGRITGATLVQFTPVTGETWRSAGELEMYRSLRSEERRAWETGLTAGTLPLLTALLVGVQVRLWWFGGGLWGSTGFPEVEVWLTTWGIRETSAIFEDGESWRMLTMGFLHTDPLHIASNMVFLAFAAYNLERTIGRANLAVLYVAAVVGGSVLSSIFGPETPSLGASGGVYGLIAAMVTVAFARPTLLGRRTRVFFLLTSLPYMIFMFLTGLMSERVDNSAHLGGLLTGLVLGLVLAPDVAERRPGDNARARSAVLELCLLALGVPLLAGPQVEPLQDAAEKRQRVPYAESLLASWGLASPDEKAEGERLSYEVPASWNAAFDALRKPAFTSPVATGDIRAWGVSERRHETLVELDELAEAWIAELRQDWPAAEVGELEPANLVGVPGRKVVARIGHGADRRSVEWRGAVRGVWSLVAVWQVDEARASWLAPLHERLLSSIRWPRPESWRLAEVELATYPDSVRAQRDFAREQILVGNWQAGVEGLWTTATADPDNLAIWISTLEDLRPVLARMENPDRFFEAALEHAPTSRIIEEVAKGLDDLGRREEAAGLLELAWRRSPGDRRIRRARRRLGLPREVDTLTGRPWEEVHDPATGESRPAEPGIDVITLSAAREAGKRLTRERELLIERARRWIVDDDPRALKPLLFLFTGRIDLDDTDAVTTLFAELEQLPGRRELPWLPEPLAHAILAEPERIERLRLPSGHTDPAR